MAHFTTETILNQPSLFRRNFMNSINGIKTAALIGSIGYRGTTNLSVFNSVFHLGATPPYIGFIIRPLTVPRHTYHNIKANGHFTINHIGTDFLERAHQTSANYPENVSEFEPAGLTEEFSDLLKAPYVKEATIKIGLSFQEEVKIEANQTILIVGKVEEIFLPENLIAEDGFVDPEKANSVGVAGLDAYFDLSFKARLPYARAEKKPHQ